MVRMGMHVHEASLIDDGEEVGVVIVLPIFEDQKLENEKYILACMTDEIYLFDHHLKRWMPFESENDLFDPSFHFENWRKAWQEAEMATFPI